MKKILFLLLAVPALLFTGCKDDEESIDVLEVVSSDIGFDAAGGTGAITLRTSGQAVQASSDKEWLTIDPSADPKVVVYTVAGYNGALGRSAQITLTSGSLSRSVTILQSGALCEISADPVTVDPAGLEATEIAFSSTAGEQPTVTVPEEADWLHATVEEEKIVLTGELNLGDPRTTTITVSQAWKPAVEIEVTQKTIALLEAETIETVRADAKEVVIPVSPYMTQVAPDWEVSADAAWIALAKSAEAVTVTLAENDTKATREGNIVVTGAGKTLYTIPVKQGPVNYDFFLGNWEMPYISYTQQGEVENTLTVTFKQLQKGQNYILDGWHFANAFLVEYVDDENPHLSLTYQYVGKAGAYYVHLGLFSYKGDLLFDDGVGMNFVYADDTTLNAEDNGKLSDDFITGFSIAAMSVETPSLDDFQGNFAVYDMLTTLTRVE